MYSSNHCREKVRLKSIGTEFRPRSNAGRLWCLLKVERTVTDEKIPSPETWNTVNQILKHAPSLYHAEGWLHAMVRCDYLKLSHFCASTRRGGLFAN